MTIFRYVNQDSDHRFWWLSNLKAPRSNINMHYVANMWEQALNLTPNTIKVGVERIRVKKDSIKTHASAIDHLLFQKVVLNPVSRYQFA